MSLDWPNLVAGAIIAFAISAVFYYFQLARRNLTYTIFPVRTELVRATRNRNLTISYRGKELGNVDVTGVHLAIWNAGNQSISKQNVRQTVAIVTEPEVPIIDLTITPWSAASKIGFAPDYEESMRDGRVPISWDILDRKEGASVQLLYIGPSDVAFALDGNIENQGKPRLAKTSPDFTTPHEYRAAVIRGVRWLFLFIVTSILFGTLKARNVQGPSDIVTSLFYISLLFLAGLALHLITLVKNRFPPGGFQ